MFVCKWHDGCSLVFLTSRQGSQIKGISKIPLKVKSALLGIVHRYPHYLPHYPCVDVHPGLTLDSLMTCSLLGSSLTRPLVPVSQSEASVATSDQSEARTIPGPGTRPPSRPPLASAGPCSVTAQNLNTRAHVGGMSECPADSAKWIRYYYCLRKGQCWLRKALLPIMSFGYKSLF